MITCRSLMPDAPSNSCPHCGVSLLRFKLPEGGSWDHSFDLACFNDDCPYYVRGWIWMLEQFGVKSSYRYRVDGQSGFASPIAVWSPEALRSLILAEGEPAGAGQKESS